MAQRPSLRGNLEKSAAVLLLPALLSFGFAVSATAEGEDERKPAAASESGVSVGAVKPEEAPKQPSGDAVKAVAHEAPAEQKTSGVKTEDAKPSPSEVKPPEPPKDLAVGTEKAADTVAPASKPNVEKETKSATGDAGSAAAKPSQESKTEEKPADAQAGSTVTPPKEAKADPKPADAKANTPAAVKPAETKDAAVAAKPKDLSPKPDATESLAVQASSVNAVYHINWLGTYIGDFKIRSSVTNRQYSLQANADISVFFGAVSWHGVTSSHGLMTANGPVPQSYSFRYSTDDRHEAIDLRFQQRMVSDIIINPPQHPGSRNVPITAGDLQNVVDPLSAVILLSQARLSRHSGDACNKRLPIFDGKIRYDLVLSPKGTRTISPTGRLHGIAYVCRVNYVPIAGHKPGKQGSDYATGNTGIEVWLVPLPEAGLLVPYYVHVPTPAGTASMVTVKFDVETSGGRHALAD